KLAADISLRKRDPARAVKLALEAVPKDSKDYRDYLWLGQVLAASGQRASEAEQPLRRALELADQMPETWVSLLQYLANRGRNQDAEALLDQARTRLPAERAPLVLALCHEALGQTDRARTQYQAAVTQQPNDASVLRNAATFYLRWGQFEAAEPL